MPFSTFNRLFVFCIFYYGRKMQVVFGYFPLQTDRPQAEMDRETDRYIGIHIER
jgi:hypothetical protein